MKRTLLIVAVTLLTTFTLASCGNTNTDNQSEEQQNEGATEDTTINDNTDQATNPDQDDMKQMMDELGYKEFELEVEYADNKEYEAKIEFDNDRFNADLENELTNEDLEGKEAFDKIFPNVQSLTIEQSTAKEDAIKQVLEAFDLDSDYNKFELEITFNDNTKIEFEDRQ